MNENVGIVGLGNIGMGMAKNLLKAGFKVHAFDLRSEALAELEKLGAVPCDSLKDLAGKCQLVFSVLVNYPQSLSVFSGPDGLVENLAPGSTIFICSTITPDQARSLADMAKAKGIECLDSPVSGGQAGANAGKLALMIGGDEKILQANQKALEAVAANINRFGDVGAGEAAKAINQILVAINLIAAGEAMVLASKCNLDLKKVYDMVSNSGGNSNMFAERAIYMMERDFETRGALSLMLKDTNIVMDAVKSLNLVLPLTDLSNQLFQAGFNNGWGDEDCAAVVKTVEQLSNHTIGSSK